MDYDFHARATAKEPLHPELAAWVEDGPFGPMIKHPLIVDITGVQFPGLTNDRFAAKKEQLAQALAEGDWHSAVFIHARPYRADALLKIVVEHGERISDKAYWKLVGSVWVDSENIWQNTSIWEELLSSERPGRKYLMRKEEREAFKALPETLTVYRGAQEDTNEDGLSWTTDRERAEWFARRLHQEGDGTPLLLVGVVAKSEVLAYFTGRGEAEVLVSEGSVRITDVEEA